jgi:hypothetical protein
MHRKKLTISINNKINIRLNSDAWWVNGLAIAKPAWQFRHAMPKAHQRIIISNFHIMTKFLASFATD